MAPLQKRALLSLIIGLVLTIALAIFLVIHGDITTFDRDANNRFVLYTVLILVPLVYLILVGLITRNPSQVDERDWRIIERSRYAQWLAAILCVVAWSIALTEIYHDAGQVPVAFLNLIFVSTLILSTLAQSIGILLAYWRMNRG